MQVAPSRKDGGSPFAADPSRTALEQIVAWSPSIDPSAILLDESPTRPAGNALTAGYLSDRTLFEQDRHRIVSADDDRFCIDLPPTGDERPLAAIILLDDMTPDRLHAVLRFWAATTRGQPPPDNRLTQQRRMRLRQMLRAVDGHQTGCSYRDIAQILFPAHKIVPAAWRGDALRETTIRLVRDGLKHVRNGYRCLLRATRRRR